MMTRRAQSWLLAGGFSLVLWLAIGALAIAVWSAAVGPAAAQSANALMGWQCKTTQPVGWCPVSNSNPLPIVTPSGGTPLDVNVKQIAGTATAAGNGATDAGTLRVTVSNDSTGNIATIGTSITPGVGAANLGKAEDSIHTTGDVGVAVWGVVTDGTTALAAQGDYTVEAVDTAGNGRVVGNVASGSADSGNPVKIGGKFNTTLPTLSDAQRSDLQLSGRGLVTPFAGAVNGSDGISNSSISASISIGASTSLVQAVQVVPLKFNGASWDRDFTCANSAVVNVAAAATTELVSLTASQIIRVCSFVLTADTAATTAKFVYGTGANCGTGTTDITGAMRFVDEGNLSASSGNGSLFRTIASNALCLTAVTGAVTGFISYSKY